MTRPSSTLVRLVWWLLLIAAFCALVGAYFWTRDYSSWYQQRRGKLSHVAVEKIGGDSLSDRFLISLRSSSGLTATCGLLVPRTERQRSPAIILLGGKQTGRYAIDYALGARNTLIIAPEYPYEPPKAYTLPQFLADVPSIRGALLDMVPIVTLITDYLWQREDVDTTRLVLLGYSFGAPFVPTIFSVERRPAVAAMVYGGGDLYSLIQHNVQQYEGRVVSKFVAALGALLLRPLEPLRYVDRISPIPLIMINGEDDELVPRRNVLALYNNAREPKRLVWLPSKHVHPKNVQLTKLILETLRRELSRVGITE
jgi:pimeloyl-ACP methyl ester carboxylesterase